MRINDDHRARLLATAVLTYPYFRGTFRPFYQPNAYHTVYYFLPENGNMDVLIDVAESLFGKSRDDGGGDAVIELAHRARSMIQKAYEITCEGAFDFDSSPLLRFRRYGVIDHSVGNLTDECLSDLELIRRRMIRRLTWNWQEEEGDDQ